MTVPLRHGSYDPDTGVASIDGLPVRLTALERRLLNHLVARPNEVVGYTELLVEVWGAHPHGSIRPIEGALARLRKRLGESGRDPVHLHTDYGDGLRFVPAAPRLVAPPSPPPPASDALPLGSAPMDPASAVQWLRDHGGALKVPLVQVVQRFGGSASVLEQIVAVSMALTARALDELDPGTVEVGGTSIASRLQDAWTRLSTSQRDHVHLLAAFAPPIEADKVAEAIGEPLMATLAELSTLMRAGWLWRSEQGFGVDAAAARWLVDQEGHDLARSRHAAFVDGQRGEAWQWRWHADVLLVRQRFPERTLRTAPGQVWFERLLGGDLTVAVERDLLAAFSLMLTRQLDEAVAAFQQIPPPEDMARRVRWALVGAELASHMMDASWCSDLLAAVEQGIDEMPALVQFQFHLHSLELQHLRGQDLEGARTAATAAADAAQRDERKWVLENQYLYYRFQRTPVLAIRERALRLSHEGAHFPGVVQAQCYLLLAERELGLPLSFDVADVHARLLNPHGYLDSQATLLLGLTLASLPDVAVAERLFTSVPTGFQHAENRLRHALIEWMLHGERRGLEAFGGAGLVDRVERLAQGDEEALPGEGWFLLRHVLRARRPQ